MKKVLISVLLLVVVVVAGCLDYKAASTTDARDDAGLVDEIAAIEKELKVGENEADTIEAGTDDAAAPAPETAEGSAEVVLPDLNEKPEDLVEEEDLETITVRENDLVKLNVRVTDPDKDKVTYSFSKPLNTNGEWKTNYGDAGDYIETIIATDGVHTTEKRVKIVVQRVNVPPVVATVNDITIKEGETVTFEPKVTDPNKDKVTVTVSEPLKNGTFVTDHTSAGQYKITISASDGELESKKSFTLTVQNVNVPPEIKGVENLQVKEGETVTIKPDVTDLDGDKVKITISNPLGDDGVWQTGYTDHGDYPITVTASDGKDTVTKMVNVKVADINMPPEIVGVTLVRR
ncbi:hypothetical protein HYU22_02445 [Candidatus Woesearchaeota archaeon]|nr:hypothetical protein [Candidatus Woesearchaeota archaeon]